VEMRTVVLDPESAGLEEVGESEDDFRVPDAGLHRPGTGGFWNPTAALVVEIVSPGDESCPAELSERIDWPE
jgi:hypothetical protein